jgi:ABC-2 type transport system ATP-binding protein
VAIDSVANLTNRLRGSEAVALEVEAADGQAQPHRSAAAPGTGGRRQPRGDEGFQGRPLTFEVESLQGRHIRAELARSVVNSGWNLSELRAVGLSLEDIFLQLTAAEPEKKEGDKK